MPVTVRGPRKTWRRLLKLFLAGSLGAGLLQVPGQAAPALAQQSLRCESGVIYSVSEDGFLREVNPDGVIAQVGTGKWEGSKVNSLGISPDGSRAYALERSGTSNSTHPDARIRIYDAATGAYTERSPLMRTGLNGVIVAGAVQPETDNFWFGGFERSGTFPLYSIRFRIFEYEADSPGKSVSWSEVGAFDTGIRYSFFDRLPSTNGDMAFDADGNLFVVRGNGTSVNLYTLSREDLIAHRGSGELPVQASTEYPAFMENINGIAFDPNGTLELGTSTTVSRHDPSNWSALGLHTEGLSASSDLASCASPATLTVTKNVTSRNLPDDQFALSIERDGVGVVSSVTEGAALGLQAQHAGPIPVLGGATYTFSEAGAGSTSLDGYSSTWTCTDTTSGSRLGSGTGPSGSVTIPLADGTIGPAVECQFTNSTEPPPQLTLVKEFDTRFGGTQEPGAWELTAIGPAGSRMFRSGEMQRVEEGTYAIGESPRAGFELARVECATGNASAVIAADGRIEVLSGQDTVCTLVNRDLPGRATWQKTDSITNEPIGGSVWELRREDGSTQRVADHIGEADYAGLDADPVPGAFALPELSRGAYELQEVEPPPNYRLGDDPPVEFTVTDEALSHDLGSRTNARSLEFGLEKFALAAGEAPDPVPLEGSEFIVHRDSSGVPGEAIPDAVRAKGPASFTLSNLEPGRYWLTETRAPSGFAKLPHPIAFAVVQDRERPNGRIELVGAESDLIRASEDGTTLRVYDPSGRALPDAGGAGSDATRIIGASLLAAAAAIALFRRWGMPMRPRITSESTN